MRFLIVFEYKGKHIANIRPDKVYCTRWIEKLNGDGDIHYDSCYDCLSSAPNVRACSASATSSRRSRSSASAASCAAARSVRSINSAVR